MPEKSDQRRIIEDIGIVRRMFEKTTVSPTQPRRICHAPLPVQGRSVSRLHQCELVSAPVLRERSPVKDASRVLDCPAIGGRVGEINLFGAGG